jgi:hypothetical protein
MEIAVNGGTGFDSFAFEAWMNCSDNKGYWQYEVHELSGGTIEVYLDRALVATRNSRTSKPIRIGNMKGGKNTLARIVFKLDNAHSGGSAKVELDAEDIDPRAESCMESSECLEKLGVCTSTSECEAAFKLRNHNPTQLKCLEENFAGMPSSLKAKCKEWLTCLKGSSSSLLETGLHLGSIPSLVAFLKAATQGQQVTGTGGAITDPVACSNPAVTDPETAECDCLDGMVEECEGVDATCFRKLMCRSTKTCPSWIKDHCGEFPESSSMMELSQTRSNASREASDFAASMDSSLKDKCMER